MARRAKSTSKVKKAKLSSAKLRDLNSRTGSKVKGGRAAKANANAN